MKLLEWKLLSVSQQTFKYRNKNPISGVFKPIQVTGGEVHGISEQDNLHPIRFLSIWHLGWKCDYLHNRESPQDVADTMDALQELLQVPISPPSRLFASLAPIFLPSAAL